MVEVGVGARVRHRRLDGQSGPPFPGWEGPVVLRRGGEVSDRMVVV